MKPFDESGARQSDGRRRGRRSPSRLPRSSRAPIDELLAEIDRLTERERADASLETERELISLRNQAGLRRLQAAPDGATVPRSERRRASGRPAARVLPEDLTPELVRAAFLRDGCCVRPRPGAARAGDRVCAPDRPLLRASASSTTQGQPYDASFYDEFKPHAQVGEDLGRPWIKEGGGVLGVDSPLFNFEMTEMLAAAANTRAGQRLSR